MPETSPHHPLRLRARREFLVSDEGAFITGSTISVNGGQHMY